MGNNISFTKEDEEISTILTTVGVKRNDSRVLVSLFKGVVLTSREIERGTDLRQPEVSVAINYLVKRKWVKVSQMMTEKKGRPNKIYQLSLSTDEILDQIKASIVGDYTHQIEFLERVRTILHESKEVNKE